MNINDPFLARNLVYGLEDSLISTTGLVVGIAASGVPRRTILVTGGILVLVEAMSMSFGAFMSEDTFAKISNLKKTTPDILKYASVMFVSYMIAGVVPMMPFFFDAVPIDTAIPASVALALAALYTLGYYTSDKNHTRAGTIAFIGGTILGISIAVGSSLH